MADVPVYRFHHSSPSEAAVNAINRALHRFDTAREKGSLSEDVHFRFKLNACFFMALLVDGETKLCRPSHKRIRILIHAIITLTTEHGRMRHLSHIHSQ